MRLATVAVAVGEGVLRRGRPRPLLDVEDGARLEESHDLGANGGGGGPHGPFGRPNEEAPKVRRTWVEVEAVALGQKIEKDPLSSG